MPLVRFHDALKIRSAHRTGAVEVAESGEIARLIRGSLLTMAYQPIADLATGEVYAHEALVRGPPGSALHLPDALFATARRERVEADLEHACAMLATASRPEHAAGRLFVNLSARALVAMFEALEPGRLPDWLAAPGFTAAMIVIEITEHEHVQQHDALLDAVKRVRQAGARIALDDFGDGRSSLRLWSELRPDYVKIDKYFAHGISRNGDKLATLRALTQIAEVFGSTMVAEGLEGEDDLTVVRDLGIALGQGWFLGRPQPQPIATLAEAARQAIVRREIAVFPELKRVGSRNETVDKLCVAIEPVAPDTSNDTLFEIFRGTEGRSAVAIVDRGRAIGLVHRQQFMDQYAKPFHRELYGRKSCTLFANVQPLMLDRATPIDELTSVLTSEDQRYLTDGFIVTDRGLYAGLGTGESLVRSVTEQRIEAARHANPLTLLPGNIPITMHIGRLIESGCEFTACYCDLDDFKPFNDKYGYWRGDEMILLASRVLLANRDARRDFVGHVGGDDFVLLLQSHDWEARCRAIVDSFGTQAMQLFDEASRQLGGIEGDDRHGVPRFFPFTTMSIGVVRVAPGTALKAEQVASAAALAKHHAKRLRAGVYISD